MTYEKILMFLLAGECRHPDHIEVYATEFIPRVTGDYSVDYSGRRDIVFDSLKNAMHSCRRKGE